MVEWAPVIFGGLMVAGACLLDRAARSRELRAVDTLRQATDVYQDARREREEAHRVLALTLGVVERQGTDEERSNG